jgi:hypothetical protein
VIRTSLSPVHMHWPTLLQEQVALDLTDWLGLGCSSRRRKAFPHRITLGAPIFGAGDFAFLENHDVSDQGLQDMPAIILDCCCWKRFPE